MPANQPSIIVARRLLWPSGTVPYSQSETNSPTGHRQDCSGYVSMCMDLPTPGENTVTLLTEGHVRRITWGELQPGDLVGILGRGTEGDNGHVMVVIGTSLQYYTVAEQRGGGPGPTTRTIRRGDPIGYFPYRSNYLTEPPKKEIRMFTIVQTSDSDTTLWLSDGMTRRRISPDNDYQEVRDLRYMASMGAISLWENGMKYWIGLGPSWGIDVTTPGGSELVPHVHDVKTTTGGALIHP